MFGRYSLVFSAALALAACAPKDGPDPKPLGQIASGPASQSASGAALAQAPTEADPDAPGKKVIQPPVTPEKAPTASPTQEAPAELKDLLDKAENHFKGANTRRIYVQVDKPLYKPGETVWIKTWDLKLRGLDAGQANGIHYELVSPKGAVVRSNRVRQQDGTATNDFEIPAGVPGGEYIIRARAFDGVTGERPIIVSAYEPPRIKKKLEFVRKAYGAGDEVRATIEIKRPTGEPLANHALRALVTLDGQALPPVELSTNAEGGGLVKFTLPAEIAEGDGLLTVLVEDGGVTESVSKRVPIILKKLKFSLFPEGGHLVEGLPGRVYFEAKTLIDKPADVEGEIVDDQGQTVARFQTYKNGLGKFAFTPATGRTYAAKINKPVGITEQYTLPLPKAEGCVLQHFDDPDGQVPELRVAVRCTAPQTVYVMATVREQLFDSAAVAVPADGAAVVYLKAKDAALAQARGIARVTVFDAKRDPVAERLVFRNRRAGLQVKITPDQAGYVPREQVALTVETTTAGGAPVPAELALSVVDDTVISFADDKK
ncbi:MAG: hypothetical protein KC613_12820, partial [Myxococcales bacterium]|nr:hypothetical protein [Myxococcales bacterium]